MPRKQFLILLGCGLALRGEPTYIAGTVQDSTGSPIAGAKVECGLARAATGPDGRFQLNERGACRAAVSYDGFATRSLVLAPGVEARVVLEPAPLRQRVVVSATRTETTLEEAGVSGDVLDAGDLAARQFPMLPDLLREVAGLQVARFGRNGGATQVFSRGAQRTGTLVLLDGVPLNDPGGDLNFAHLLTGDIDRVEVVRGAQSALFGAEASSAVIQLFTRRGDPERRLPHGQFSYERGSFQTDRWTASLSGGAGERIDYSLAAEQFHTVSEFPNDFYRNTTGSANAGWRLTNSTEIRGLLRTFDSAVGVPNRTAYGVYDFDANRANRDYAAAIRVEDVRGRAFVHRFQYGWHRLRDLFTDLRADGPYTVAALLRDTGRSVYLERLVDPRNPGPVPPGLRLVTRSVRLAPLPAPSLSVNERHNADYQATATHHNGATLFGYEFERQNGGISGRAVERGNHGAFLQRQQTVAGRLFLSGGVRLEQNSVFRTKLTPRGAASVRLWGERGAHSSTFLRLSAGRGITEPSLLQTYARDSTFVGNPSLRLEKTNSYEIGLVQEWFGRRLRTEAAAFRNSFRDLIVFVSPPFPALGTWENVEASWSRGFEFTTQARVWRWVRLNGSYTRLWSKVTRSNTPFSLSTGLGQELLRRPGNSGAVSVSLAPRRWSLQAGAMFLGERQDTDVIGVTRNPGYQHVWLSGSWQWRQHVTPFLRADNLLNSRYQEVLGYSSLSRVIRGGVRIGW